MTVNIRWNVFLFFVSLFFVNVRGMNNIVLESSTKDTSSTIRMMLLTYNKLNETVLCAMLESEDDLKQYSQDLQDRIRATYPRLTNFFVKNAQLASMARVREHWLLPKTKSILIVMEPCDRATLEKVVVELPFVKAAQYFDSVEKKEELISDELLMTDDNVLKKKCCTCVIL